MPLRHTLLAVLFPILMAIQALASKVGQSEFPPLFMLALRFALVALIMVPFVKRPDRNDMPWLVGLSVVQGALMMGFFFWGIGHTGAATATVVYQLYVPVGVGLSFIAFGERTSVVGLVGIAICLAGIAVAAWPEMNAARMSGIPVIALSAVSMALGNVIARFLGGMPPHTMNAWMAFIAAPCVLVASLFAETAQAQSLQTAGAVGWLALATTVVVGGIAALSIWYHLLGRYPIAQVTPYGLLQPGFVAVLAWIALSEPMTLSLIVGATITVTGVLLILRDRKQQELAREAAGGGSQISSHAADAVDSFLAKRANDRGGDRLP